MDDARKSAASAAQRIEPDAKTTSKDSSESFVAFMNEPAPAGAPSETGQKENLTTSAKALDRWFKERQKNHGAPRMLEIPNETMISSGGPLQIVKHRIELGGGNVFAAETTDDT